MYNKKPIEKVMLANGDVTVGFLNDEEFKEHITYLCDKYNTEVVSRQTFSSDEYEEMMTAI
jgi:hypothetical protein